MMSRAETGRVGNCGETVDQVNLDGENGEQGTLTNDDGRRRRKKGKGRTRTEWSYGVLERAQHEVGVKPNVL